MEWWLIPLVLRWRGERGARRARAQIGEQILQRNTSPRPEVEDSVERTPRPSETVRDAQWNEVAARWERWEAETASWQPVPDADRG